jgi:hypothetical protein
VSVGATLEARDRAVALVADVRDATTTREGAERRISKLERRGTSARARLERGVGQGARPGRADRRQHQGSRRGDRLAPQTSPGAPTESGTRDGFAGLISRRRMQYLSSLNRRRALGHGGGA